MIKSMTGYGQATFSSENNVIISVELKSVNHRYRDISIKLPSILSATEREIKKRIESLVERGKVDVYINVDIPVDSETAYEINMPLAKSYTSALNKLSEELNLDASPKIADIAPVNNIIQLRKLGESDISQEELLEPVDDALQAFNEMRKCEGGMLCEDMENRLANTLLMADRVFDMQPDVIKSYAERLKKRVKTLTDGIELDESKLIQEVAIMSDRCDITEEVVRLRSHISQFNELLNTESGAVGRKLDFLLQEMNREVNTIGSKGNDPEISRQVVDMKAEIERIKEQVQNVE